MKGKPNTIATEMERRGKYANKSTVSYNVMDLYKTTYVSYNVGK